MDPSEHPAIDFTKLTANIVSAYVIHHSLPSADLPAVIASVHVGLSWSLAIFEGAGGSNVDPESGL